MMTRLSRKGATQGIIPSIVLHGMIAFLKIYECFGNVNIRWPEHLPPTAKGQATFLRDGSGIMERRSFINFTVTALLQQCFFQLGQTPEPHGLQINPHAFFQAFSYIDADGNRVHPSPPVPGLQESGEGSNVCGSSQDAYHQSQTGDIRKFVEDVKKRLNKALDIRSAAIGNPSSVETGKSYQPRSLCPNPNFTLRRASHQTL
jgi:hypothetical protein